MAFDADAAVEALAPPAFIAGGRRYTGRVLSVMEWVRLHARKAELTRAPSARAVDRMMRDCIVDWFPARGLWRLAPRAWNPAWRAFRQLPETVRMQAIADFSESQRRAMPPLAGVAPDAAPGAPPGTMEPAPETTPETPPSPTS